MGKPKQSDGRRHPTLDPEPEAAGDASTSNEKKRPTRPRIFQRASPAHQRDRGRYPQCRWILDSAPSRPHRQRGKKRGIGHMEEFGESATRDSDGEKPDGPPRNANPQISRPRIDKQPSCMKSSGIYGTEAQIPICRDPATHQSERRRADMNVVEEFIAVAMGKGEKARNLSVVRMNRFALDSLWLFGGYRIPPASGVGRCQLVDALRRIAIFLRRELYRSGIRSFLNGHARGAISSGNFGQYTNDHEKEYCMPMGDFRGQPRGQLYVYFPANTEPVRIQPVTIIEFQEMSNRKTLLT